MKKFHKCPECKNEYDAFLSRCPTCEHENKTFPLKPRFARMIFLSDYKEFVIFIAGFLGLMLFILLMTIALGNFPIDNIIKNVWIYFVAYAITFGVMFCIMWRDSILIFRGAKKYRSIIAGVIGGGLIIIFYFACRAIMLRCGIDVFRTEDSQMIIQMSRNMPGLAVFLVVIFAPVAQEFCYRLGLFSVLRKRNRILAYLVPIILYSLVNFNFLSTNLLNEVYDLPFDIVPCLLLCVLYEYEGFNASIYAHVLANIATFILFFVQP